MPEGSGVFLSHDSGVGVSGRGSKCHLPRGTAKPWSLCWERQPARWTPQAPDSSRGPADVSVRTKSQRTRPSHTCWHRFAAPATTLEAWAGPPCFSPWHWPVPPLRRSPLGSTGAFGLTEAPWSDTCSVKAPGNQPRPGSHRSASSPRRPPPGLLDQPPETAQGLENWSGVRLEGSPSACRQAPVGPTTALRPLCAAARGSAGVGCCPELVLRPVADLGRQPFPPLH